MKVLKAQTPKEVDGRMAAAVDELVKQCTRNAEDVGSAPTCGKLSLCPLLFLSTILFQHLNQA